MKQTLQNILKKISRWFKEQYSQKDSTQKTNTDFQNEPTSHGQSRPDSLVTPFAIAKTQLGISEQYNDERIKRYHKSAGLDATKTTPWCASFVSYCFEMSDFADQSVKSPLSTDWLKFGVPTKEPKQGDIVVLTRPNGAGHVGLFVDKNQNGIKLLSGNCDNEVKYKYYDESRLVGYRTFK